MTKNTRREFATALGSALFAIHPTGKALAANTVVDREVELNPESTIGLIRPELHGQFAEHLGSCIYGGLWVGRNSKIPNLNGYRTAAIEYLRVLGVPVLRWPGGCFADDYHWRDGIGPADKRPRTVNIHWGHYVEDNSFGTHEFMGLCQLIGAQPYLAGNVGSGAPEEMRDWMEYCNFPGDSSLAQERTQNGSPAPFNVKYWGVGNELWGCGGNLSGDEYAELYRRFTTFLSRFGDTSPFLIACGPDRDRPDWTNSFLAGMHKKHLPDGYTMHFYSNSKSTPTEFTLDDMNAQFATISQMEEAILHQRRLMDNYDPDKKMGLMVDEWGVWDRMIPDEERTRGRLWQQITIRSAITTALGLNVFHRQADKLVMCNIAQIVNVLDSMLLTENDQCIRTPAYYAFLLTKAHLGGMSIASTPPQANPTDLSVSASINRDALAVTFVNPKPDAALQIRCVVRGRAIQKASARTLANPDINACNSFQNPDAVTPRSLDVRIRPEAMLINAPPLSVTTVEAELSPR